MNSLKRIISTVLAVLMLICAVPSVFAEEGNSDYFLSYPEVGGKLDLPYAIADALPEKYSDHFETLLKNPVYSKDHMYLFDLSVIGNTFTFSMKTVGSIYANYKAPYTSSEEIVHIKDIHFMAAVYENDTGNILGVQRTAN